MDTSGRIERECPWCAELILAKARICKHCGRDVTSADLVSVPVLNSSMADRHTKPFPRLAIPIPPEARVKVAVGLAALLSVLYLIKHYLTFSLTNFTFFLFLPIGPVLIGMALGWLIVPGPNREPLNYRWLVFFVVKGLR